MSRAEPVSRKPASTRTALAARIDSRACLARSRTVFPLPSREPRRRIGQSNVRSKGSAVCGMAAYSIDTSGFSGFKLGVYTEINRVHREFLPPCRNARNSSARIIGAA